MTKKYIDKDHVRAEILLGLRDGRPRSVILAELETLYFGRDQLVKMVIGTPHPDVKKKFRFLNTLLGLAAIMLVLMRFWTLEFDYLGGGLSLLTLMLAISAFSNEPITYRLMSIISIVTFLKSMAHYNFNVYFVIDFVLTVLVIVLGLYLGSKLFPKYGVLGPRKDSNGQIIID